MGSSHLGSGQGVSLNKAIVQLQGSGEMLEAAHFVRWLARDNQGEN
jgi:hypothetical protein